MTKERRLAIKMWKDIRDMISTSDGLTSASVVNYKEIFCKERKLQWLNNCWFCQYIPICNMCPLVSCGFSSSYEVTVSEFRSKDVRIAACNDIIKALGGRA